MRIFVCPKIINVKTFITKHRQILLYGIALSWSLFVLKWLQWNFIIEDHSTDIYIGLIAVFFTLLGIWIAQQLYKPETKTVIIEKKIYIPQPQEEFTVNHIALENINLSRRERDVLQLIAKGMSNAEIAEQLFLSLSTVKTHVSKVFVKMDVKSRTKAIEKSKRLGITP